MKKLSFLLLCLFVFEIAAAQQFLFQGWTWQYPVLYAGKRYAQRIADKAPQLSQAGFTHIWVPPLSRGSGGSGSMGYDIQDLYDLGQYNGMVRAGTRAQIDNMIDKFHQNGMDVVADMVYNHRDNGAPENNNVVGNWIKNYNGQGTCPYPSGSFRCLLPLGGTSGNTAGTYYFKFSSATQNAAYLGRTYEVTMWTNTVPISGSSTIESEPNGGGDCAQAHDTIHLGEKMLVTIDNVSGCATDEFAVVIGPNDFNAAGDTLYIIMPNTTLSLGYYTDHRIYGIWSGPAGADIVNNLQYQTYTDFNHQPSGRGGMNYLNFRPNGLNPTSLCGDYDGMWFFYDYDQTYQGTKDTLYEWTRWMHQDVGINGMRVDAIKHFPPYFMGDMFDYLYNKNVIPSMAVGEYFDYNAFTLKGWLDGVLGSMDASTKTAIQPKIFDFPLRESMRKACDEFGYDVRNVFKESTHDKAGVSGFNLVTFVENHDYDNVGEIIHNDPKLAYAYILTNNQLGVPCVFEKDYYGTPTDTANNIRAEINGLIEAHKKYITGANWVDYLNKLGTTYTGYYGSGYPNTTLLYQLSQTNSGRDVIVAINFAGDTLDVAHTINGTNLQPGDTLTDIFSESGTPYEIVDNNYFMHFKVAPRSFGVWVEGNLTDSLITIIPSANENSIFASPVVSLAPNPFSTDFTLTLEGKANLSANVEVLNLEGKKVYEEKLPSAKGSYAIKPNLSVNGVYIVVVSVNGRKYYQKLMQN